MALTSMTGHGVGEASGKGAKVVVELSAVNRRQFDLRVNVPRPLASLEPGVHALVRRVVSRGSVAAVVVVSDAGPGETTRRARVDVARRVLT